MSNSQNILSEPELIRASAGAGKTFQLTGRVIGLLAAGEAPQQILATTFTRKAAGEIRDRVLERIADAAHDQDARDSLRAHEVADLSPEEAMHLLHRLVDNAHLLQFCTLDSFFVAILRCFALDLGHSATWRLIDETEDVQIRTEAIALALRDGPTDRTDQLIQLLSGAPAARPVHEQLIQAVGNFYATFCETEKEAWQWLKTGKPIAHDEIMNLFASVPQASLPTNKDGKPNANWEKLWNRLGEIIANNNWDDFIKETIIQNMLEKNFTFSRKQIPDQIQQVLQNLIEQARRILLTRVAKKTSAIFEMVSRFDKHYRLLKKQAGVLTFRDITQSLALGAIEGRLDEIYYRLDARIAHLLLDEFQDTSLQQWKVLEPIADEVLASAGEIRKFFCVGDVKQAIYGWRGGVAEIFGTLRARWPQLKDDPITETYRCRPQIVETVNQIFGSLGSSDILKEYPNVVSLWHDQFDSHHAAITDQNGFVCLEATNADPKLKPKELSAFTKDAAAERIAEICRQRPSTEIGVLVRTNAAVAEMIYRLSQLNPPIYASEEGGNPLTDSPAVNTVLALLRLADHPGDQVARFRVFNSPLRAIVGLNTLEAQESDRLAKTIRAKLMTEGYGSTIWEWVIELAQYCDERDTSRLSQLANLAARFEDRATTRPIDFVRHVEVVRIESATASPVRVMTIHQSKGLQFDAVILPELDKSLLRVSTHQPLTDRENPTLPPHRVICNVRGEIRALSQDLISMQEQAEQQQLSEALSVLYVAITRARFALYLFINPQKPNEKHLPKTFAGLLRSLLPNCPKAPPGEVLFEAGDSSWLEKMSRGTLPDSLRALPKPDLLPPDPNDFRSLIEQSPSELAGGRQTINLHETLQINTEGATQRGTVFHKWFEQIEWLDKQGAPPEDLLRLEAMKLHAPSNLIDEWLQTFYACLKQDGIQKQLSSTNFASGAEVFNERRFAVRLGDKMLRGAIDRLIIEPDRAVVIDFKTDQLNLAGGKDQLAKHYEPQLEAYCRAVANFQHLAQEKVEARILFTESGECTRI